jgi:predicted aminopeptidase
LNTLYASGIDAALMRERKRAVFAEARESYARLEAGWGADSPFESWFDGRMNNANLASIATYYDCVPGFERELAAVGGDLARFYARVHELAKLGQTVRDAAVCTKP